MAFTLRTAHLNNIEVRKFLHSRKVTDAMESRGYKSVTAVEKKVDGVEAWYLTPHDDTSVHVFMLSPLSGHAPLDHPFELIPLRTEDEPRGSRAGGPYNH